MNTNNLAHVHALRYATELIKEFQMEEYRLKYPLLFQTAVLELRKATSRDYYIPPSLERKCVVGRTRFEEEGCQTFSCFPFKENLEMCGEGDAPRWISIGDRFEMACQPSCRYHSLNTESVDGRCVVANPLKKVLAAMPEKLFERSLRPTYHGGLDVVNGTLALNRRYCNAYGLDFGDADCYFSGGQSFGEWLLGKSPIRASKTKGVQPYKPDFPPLPPYVHFIPRRMLKRRARKTTLVESGPSPENRIVFREIALQLMKELGKEVPVWVVEKFVRIKAPKLMTSTLNTLSVKLVIKHFIATSVQQTETATWKFWGKGFGWATHAHTLYEVGIRISNILDLYGFEKVLNTDALRQIDRDLDYSYFKDGAVRPEITPEFIWENDLLMRDDDESGKFSYMAELVKEYLVALETAPPSESALSQPERVSKINSFQWKKDRSWDRNLFTSLFFVTVCLAVLLIDWVHVWSCCLFFFRLYFRV